MAVEHGTLSPAINGYDVVAYFDGEAKTGDPAFGSSYDGQAYYFSSPENKTCFETDPAQYLPAYGGYCATAMSEGNVFGSDPTNFLVSNGRLFLFYRGVGGDTKPQWETDAPALMAKADQQWDTQTK